MVNSWRQLSLVPKLKFWPHCLLAMQPWTKYLTSLCSMPHVINTLSTLKLRRLNKMSHIKKLVQYLVLSNTSVLAIIIVAMMFMLMQPSHKEAGLLCLYCKCWQNRILASHFLLSSPYLTHTAWKPLPKKQIPTHWVSAALLVPLEQSCLGNVYSKMKMAHQRVISKKFLISLLFWN